MLKYDVYSSSMHKINKNIGRKIPNLVVDCKDANRFYLSFWAPFHFFGQLKYRPDKVLLSTWDRRKKYSIVALWNNSCIINHLRPLFLFGHKIWFGLKKWPPTPNKLHLPRQMGQLSIRDKHFSVLLNEGESTLYLIYQSISQLVLAESFVRSQNYFLLNGEALNHH